MTYQNDLISGLSLLSPIIRNKLIDNNKLDKIVVISLFTVSVLSQILVMIGIAIYDAYKRLFVHAFVTYLV